MKKILILAVALLASIFSANAQETTTSKQTVVIDNFTLPGGINTDFLTVAEVVRNKVIAAIVKSQRVNIVDVVTDPSFADLAKDTLSSIIGVR